MSNMSYCRYSNTAPDFEDCLKALCNDGLADLGETERMTILPVESVHGDISYLTCDESVEIYNNGMLCYKGSRKNAELMWQDVTGVTLKGEDYEEYMALSKSLGLQSGTISMVLKESGEVIKTATIE